MVKERFPKCLSVWPICNFIGWKVRGCRVEAWWARQGLNLRPHPCEGCALPLSYAPASSTIGVRKARPYASLDELTSAELRLEATA